MNLRGGLFLRNFSFVAACLVAAAAYGQQSVITDWSTHHVIFSNPGSEMNALMQGKRQAWQRLVYNPRYQMQQLGRSTVWANRLTKLQAAIPEPRTNGISTGRGLRTPIAEPRSNADSVWGPTGGPIDWAVSIAPAGSGTALGMDPVTFASFDNPSCGGDYVAFPVDIGGRSGTGDGQANIVGFNNLYKGTCTGSVPTVAFAYFVGEGSVQTSPVISLDGTKLAFIESKNGTTGTRSNFHVLTLGTTGNNGSVYNSPAVPHTIVDNGTTTTTTATNNATDRYITLQANPNVTRSSPYIDYANDVAYVGDDNGELHKFTGVFNGTLTEVTTGGWPFTVASGEVLTGPMLDSTSGNIVVGAGSDLYCIVSASPAYCATRSVNVANGVTSSSASIDPPIVDSTAEMVYSEAEATSDCGKHCTDTASILMQAPISASGFGSAIRVAMGAGGTDLFSGDFDNEYYSSATGTGHLYFCGNTANAATPELYSVAITDGVMANSSTAIYQLVLTGQAGTKVSCTPLTEAFNGTTDFMFVGVQGQAAPAACNYSEGASHHTSGCILSFILPSSGAAPSAPNAVYSLRGNNSGASGIVIDNESNEAGTSQIYFTNLVTGTATQVAQNGLD